MNFCQIYYRSLAAITISDKSSTQKCEITNVNHDPCIEEVEMKEVQKAMKWKMKQPSTVRDCLTSSVSQCTTQVQAQVN
jgi:hypothetical protein